MLYYICIISESKLLILNKTEKNGKKEKPELDLEAAFRTRP